MDQIILQEIKGMGGENISS